MRSKHSEPDNKRAWVLARFMELVYNNARNISYNDNDYMVSANAGE